MFFHHGSSREALLRAVAFVVALSFAGCGYITDKDRIRIARVDDEYITRGSFARVLRAMPDDERPAISTKGDLRRALNSYINEELKQAKGQQLLLEGKIQVSREIAEGAYFQMHPEYRHIMAIEDPRAMDVSVAEFEAMKAEIEMGIDRMQDRLLGDFAIGHMARQAMDSGEVDIPEERFEQEYESRKDELLTLESMEFIALRFPTSLENAAGMAADVRRRLDAGEDMDDLIEEYSAINPQFVFRSAIENNPERETFRTFWMTASDAEVGDIIGPVFLPGHELLGRDSAGRTTARQMPDAYMVLEVLEHSPEETKSLEEAKPDLIPFILYGMMLNQLRDEADVEIYDDNLPDPRFIWESL